MASEWRLTNLGDLGSFRNGLNFNRQQEGRGLEVLKVKDFGDRVTLPTDALDELDVTKVTVSSNQMLQGGDTVIIRSNGNRDLVGRSMYCPSGMEPIAYSGFCIRFRPNKEKIDPRFAAYLIRSPYFREHLTAWGSGTSIQNLSQSVLANVPVQLPPLPEQRAIAGVLGSLDDKIELNRRMNRTLESMARALFKSWFIDFDPVHANAAGQPTLPPDLATHFPASFEPSALGEIPEGWEVKPIGDAVECLGGGTPSTKNDDYWEGGTHHWATPKDLSSIDAPVLTTTGRKLTDAGIKKVSSGLLERGTVLMSSRAPVGYLAIAEVPVAINQGFVAMKPTERMPTAYLLNWCLHNMDTIKGQASGTTFAEISKKAFRPIPALVPPADVAPAFAGLVDPMYERITQNVRENETLAALRDALLPKLLSGELSAGAAAEHHHHDAGVFFPGAPAYLMESD